MNKLVIGGMSTLSAVVLLMSYPTSMSGKDANISLDAALPVTEAGDKASVPPTPSTTAPVVSETSPSPTTTTTPPKPSPTTTTQAPQVTPTTTTEAPQLEKPKPQPVKPTHTPKPAKPQQPKPQPVKPQPVEPTRQPVKPQPVKPTENPKPQPVGKQRINGPTVNTKYGPVQATIVVEDGMIRRAGAAQYPAGSAQSRRINQMALPDLIQQSLLTQSANIDMISGATITSRAFRQSLQAAINKANL